MNTDRDGACGRVRLVAAKAAFLLTVLALQVGSASAAEPAAGPKDQFQSVIYVRAVDKKSMDYYRKIKPQSLAMFYPADFYQWGGKYCYSWFSAVYVVLGGKDEGMPDLKDPGMYFDAITPSLWNNWDKLRAAGVLTGERPARFEDLCIMSREFALAQRDGVPAGQKPPERIAAKGKTQTYLCMANPAARQMMVDFAKFNATHRYNHAGAGGDSTGPYGNPGTDTHDITNAGFIDLDGGPWADYSEFARAAFDAWMRANYTPEQVRAILGVAPGQPIPILAPKDMPAAMAQRLARLYREWYWNVLTPDHCRTQKEAMNAVLGPAKFHFMYHGDGYEWRVVSSDSGYPTNMVCWGDWLDSYCTECGRTPGAWHLKNRFFAFPDAVLDARPNVYFNGMNTVVTNVYDYEYGAGRLWGEPVMVKAGFRGPGPFRLPAVAQLAVAEGLALQGNMGIYLCPEGQAPGKYIPGSFILPVTDLAQRIAPQVRQMIPAARVGVAFSPADSWLFRAGFNGPPTNDTQAYEVSQICHRQHVPLQVVHLGILDQTLAKRPMDVLVLPWVRCVKDEQAAAITKFVQGGGKALFIGDCGTLTYEGLQREKNAFADLLPPADPAKTTLRQVGKGKTALLPGALDWGAAQGERFQQALFDLLDHTPSCIQPDKYPLLLANLARNSDNSRVWMHLVNYDVDLGVNADATKTANPLTPARDVRVVVPLPEGRRAKAATLYRPGAQDVPLQSESGLEGCAVTVPAVDIYALVAVETEPGDRPAKALFQPANRDEAAKAVAKSFDAEPATQVLAAPPGPLPPDVPYKQRGFFNGLVAYATSAGGQPVLARVPENVSPDALIAYQSDGRRVTPEVRAEKAETVFSFPAPPAGGYLAIRSATAGLRFAHKGGGCFEASLASPVQVREPKDSEPWFFYVPKACKGFTLHLSTNAPVHLVVKDDANGIRTDLHGNFSGQDMKPPKEMKPIKIEVPPEHAGRVWSLWFLDDHPAQGGNKDHQHFALEGVPPLVAQTPSQLLTPRGEQ